MYSISQLVHQSVSPQPVTPVSQYVCLLFGQSVDQSVSQTVRQSIVTQSICQPVTPESFLPHHHVQLLSHSITLNSHLIYFSLRVSFRTSVRHIILLTNEIIRRKRLHGVIVLMAGVPLPS